MPDQTAISDLIQQLPVSVHLMALSGLIIGVIVLLAGGKLLRALVALLGAAFGAIVGLTLIALFPDSSDPVLGMLIGAGAGLVLGIALYRFYMAIALALLFGLAAPVSVFAFNSITGTWQPAEGPLPIEEQMLDGVPVTDAENGEPEAPADGTPTDAADAEPIDPDASLTDEMTEQITDLLDESGATEALRDEAIQQLGDEAGLDSERAQDLADQARPVLDTAGRIMRSIFGECRDRFQMLPASQQWSVSVAAVIGMILGGVIGLLLPASAATLVASAAGAALTISSASWLAARYEVPIVQDLPTQPTATLIVWAALWIGGTVFQWTAKRPKPDD
jgi:hypothetical protein